MSKKLTSFLLAFVILGSAIPLTVSASAEGAGDLTASDQLVQLIKNFEGFTKYVYTEASKSYIGYGTSCKPGDYPNGITKEEADALLRKKLGQIGSTLNGFLRKYSISLTQNQYDALLSFTYNLGTGWLGYTNRLRTYLINGIENYTDMEIVNAFGVWCHIGKSVSSHLVKRKLIEANIFLYGEYGQSSHEYRYIIFDPGAGEVETDIVFYEYGKPYDEIQKPVLEGYTFKGWFTADGEKISPDQTADKNLKVVASWSEGVEPVSNEPEPEAPKPGSLYNDVHESAWYYTYVSELSQNSVISGYPDGTFKPEKPVTCGEALKLIMLAAGYEPKAATGSHWASGFLDHAIYEGLVDPNDITDLDAPISRQIIAHIAAKALGLPQSGIISPFTDTSDGYVLSLYEIGIVQGSSENGAILYLPEKSMSRSEISAVIWRINDTVD